MSRIATPAVGHMQNLARNPIMIALFVGLSLAGCASKKGLPNDANGLGLNGAGNAAPGSPQDFTVNVGDRIFFDTDSSSIRADASQTLDRQAQWLASLSELFDHRRRPCRRTRYARIQPGSRCSSRFRRQATTLRFAWRSGSAHEDDFLWQGTPGRHLRRYFLLVAEPSRRHRAQRRRFLISRNSGQNAQRRPLWPPLLF